MEVYLHSFLHSAQDGGGARVKDLLVPPQTGCRLNTTIREDTLLNFVPLRGLEP